MADPHEGMNHGAGSCDDGQAGRSFTTRLRPTKKLSQTPRWLASTFRPAGRIRQWMMQIKGDQERRFRHLPGLVDFRTPLACVRQ